MKKVNVVFTDRASRESRFIPGIGIPGEGSAMPLDEQIAKSLQKQKFLKIVTSTKPKRSKVVSKED